MFTVVLITSGTLALNKYHYEKTIINPIWHLEIANWILNKIPTL
jgi:hypothetical protein